MILRFRFWLHAWLWRLKGIAGRRSTGLVVRYFALRDLPSRSLSLAPASGAAGFNVVGFISAEMGLGQHARNLIAALRSSGFGVRTADVSYLTNGPCADQRWSDLEGKLEPGWPVIHLYNPDVGAFVIRAFGARSFSRFPRHIAIWNWELEALPPGWARFASLFDEVWAASHFTAQAIANAIGRPCPVLPIPVLAEESSGLTRTAFCLPQDRFLFLFMFDMNSAAGRKNPHAVLAAFQDAFPVDQPGGPALVIKVLNGSVDPGRMAELRRISAGGRLHLIDRPLARGEVLDLQRCCDCFVSLHRAEGFGLGPAEAMRLGKPVISTQWSGTADFVTDATAMPIAARLIPVEGIHGHYVGQRWADPDHGEAVAAMRCVAQEPELRRRIGEAAQELMVTRFSPAAIGSLIVGHLGGSKSRPEVKRPDIAALPLISVITASYNQGRFIAATIRSVLEQGYPRIEHIVVDGGSTDDTADVLAGFPHLVVICERDRGQADAINKGFRRATGDILCFLNSDDTFEPGTLALVAERLGPARSRDVISGRCRYIDAGGRDIGLEHISAPFHHDTLLRPWHPHPVPQPSVFWTRSVYGTIGGLDSEEHLVLDFEYFCRMTRLYQVEWIDRILSTYRLHPASKTTATTTDRVLAASLRVVRPMWGSWYQPRRWGYEFAWLAYRLDHGGRTLVHLRRARQLQREGRLGAGLIVGAVGLLLCPWRVIPRLFRRLWRHRNFVRSRLHRRAEDLAGSRYRNYLSVHPDGWVGPQVMLADPPEGGGAGMNVHIVLDFPAVLEPGDGEIFWLAGNGTKGVVPVVGGRVSIIVPGADDFQDLFPLRLDITPWHVPDEVVGNGDIRPLCARLDSVSWEAPDQAVAENGARSTVSR
jgi:glycosyltransferase involved in cell wall biosynthesis